jgi:hypothetical protein
MMDDPDRATFDALLELAETGVDTSDAIGDLLDRRAAEEEAFQALTAPLEPVRPTQVVWPDDSPEARLRRLERAKVIRVSVGT